MKTQVFAFAKISDPDARAKVYQEVKAGKSRFGMWSQTASLLKQNYGKNAFLLRVKKGDWIVHVNMPAYGQCTAVKAIGEYAFDEGVTCSWGADFNNYIPVDAKSRIEFNRNNPNILPSVNLAPRKRAQRVLAVEDFLASLDNLKEGTYDALSKQEQGLNFLQEKVNALLPEITKEIQNMNRSKDFERFLHRIFSGMPNTLAIQNGFGWGTDHGADLLVEFDNPIVGINVTTKLVVQAKSYTGKHYDTKAIDQIVEGINTYDADAGLLITTATETEALEEYVTKKSEEIGKTIDVIAGHNVAKFVLRYAPELLMGN